MLFARIPLSTVPLRLTPQVHPSLPRLLFRVPSLLDPARALSGPSCLPGFQPSSRRHRVRPLITRHPSASLRFAHRFSRPLGDFLRTPASRACFIPQPRPGFVARSGASLPAQHPFLRQEPLPPCRWLSDRSPRRSSTSTIGVPRLRGFLRAGPRSSGSVISLPASRSPLRVLSPPG